MCHLPRRRLRPSRLLHQRTRPPRRPLPPLPNQGDGRPQLAASRPPLDAAHPNRSRIPATHRHPRLLLHLQLLRLQPQETRMSDMTPKAATDLRKPFPPESVGKLPKGGTMLDYVGHAAVTDRLLTVDPNWTWEPFALDANGLPAIQNGNLWIRLTVCGVTRIGVGD